jgi:hypothetical protein
MAIPFLKEVLRRTDKGEVHPDIEWSVIGGPACGIGMVGFDLGHLAWSRNPFDAQHSFLIKILDAALAEPMWNRLPYESLFIESYIQDLRILVSSLKSFDMIESHKPPANWPWSTIDEIQSKCEHHKAYPGDYGCLLCNEAGR